MTQIMEPLATDFNGEIVKHRFTVLSGNDEHFSPVTLWAFCQLEDTSRDIG